MLLTGRTRDAPARQQTLRATLDWSYSLLDPSEQQLFRLLSVFVGGCTLEAVGAVCGDESTNILDGVTSLLDKSMLRQRAEAGGEPRLFMLETTREYGLEHL